MKGRHGVRLKPFGSIPIDSSGYENVDKFWSPSAELDESVIEAASERKKYSEEKEKERQEKKAGAKKKNKEKPLDDEANLYYNPPSTFKLGPNSSRKSSDGENLHPNYDNMFEATNPSERAAKWVSRTHSNWDKNGATPNSGRSFYGKDDESALTDDLSPVSTAPPMTPILAPKTPSYLGGSFSSAAKSSASTSTGSLRTKQGVLENIEEDLDDDMEEDEDSLSLGVDDDQTESMLGNEREDITDELEGIGISLESNGSRGNLFRKNNSSLGSSLGYSDKSSDYSKEKSIRSSDKLSLQDKNRHSNGTLESGLTSLTPFEKSGGEGSALDELLKGEGVDDERENESYGNENEQHSLMEDDNETSMNRSRFDNESLLSPPSILKNKQRRNSREDHSRQSLTNDNSLEVSESTNATISFSPLSMLKRGNHLEEKNYGIHDLSRTNDYDDNLPSVGENSPRESLLSHPSILKQKHQSSGEKSEHNISHEEDHREFSPASMGASPRESLLSPPSVLKRRQHSSQEKSNAFFSPQTSSTENHEDISPVSMSATPRESLLSPPSILKRGHHSSTEKNDDTISSKGSSSTEKHEELSPESMVATQRESLLSPPSILKRGQHSLEGKNGEIYSPEGSSSIRSKRQDLSGSDGSDTSPTEGENTPRQSLLSPPSILKKGRFSHVSPITIAKDDSPQSNISEQETRSRRSSRSSRNRSLLSSISINSANNSTHSANRSEEKSSVKLYNKRGRKSTESKSKNKISDIADQASSQSTHEQLSEEGKESDKSNESSDQDITYPAAIDTAGISPSRSISAEVDVDLNSSKESTENGEKTVSPSGSITNDALVDKVSGINKQRRKSVNSNKRRHSLQVAADLLTQQHSPSNENAEVGISASAAEANRPTETAVEFSNEDDDEEDNGGAGFTLAAQNNNSTDDGSVEASQRSERIRRVEFEELSQKEDKSTSGKKKGENLDRSIRSLASLNKRIKSPNEGSSTSNSTTPSAGAAAAASLAADAAKKEEKYREKKKRKKKTKTRVSVSPKGQGSISYKRVCGNREYEYIPVSDYKASSPESEDSTSDTPRRRSKRARFPPLEFWRNEHLVYESNDRRVSFGANTQIDVGLGDMPVVTGVNKQLPTPMKEIKFVNRKGGKKKRRKSDRNSDESSSDSENDELKTPKYNRNETPFNDAKLRENLKILDGDTAEIYDEITNEIVDKKIVSYASSMASSDLPVTTRRQRGEGRVAGKAAQAFNVPSAPAGMSIPGWIAGQLKLPPNGIKDAESVGLCSQVFFVSKCQPNSFEASLAKPEQEDEYDPTTAQRFLLSPGDFFQVPPNNSYRLQNHSASTDCEVFWTIIRPLPPVQAESPG
eukprot:CAMPEP_0194363270 /NCGR_PEP_ID=MMETSP0174-20130528/11111_1 /TAXON_ID=216777 /ORGANISM="Proboscia alata, Strain PI-D3" /LENGTH=1356 /DNA_ID=CAMNT_0039136623 /DNA_START=338 /DNA_END=4408 /DNA_ORIENTATION=+